MCYFASAEAKSLKVKRCLRIIKELKGGQQVGNSVRLKLVVVQNLWTKALSPTGLLKNIPGDSVITARERQVLFKITQTPSLGLREADIKTQRFTVHLQKVQDFLRILCGYNNVAVVRIPPTEYWFDCSL